MRTGLADVEMQRSARNLAGLIVEMAKQHTNVLLQLFSDVDTIVRDQKYPQRPLSLFDGRIQAYYHTHEKNILSEHEHGHFHIFLKSLNLKVGGPVHLVALSMDHYGQPRSWFTVNQWVTSRACYDGKKFLDSINLSPVDEKGNLIEQWLATMLQFYQDKIAYLLDSSHLHLNELGSTLPASTSILDDKSVYFIDDINVDLARDLGEMI